MYEPDEITTFIKNVITEAGNIILNSYKTPLDTRVKNGVMDIVTNADLKSNDFITTSISNKFPTHTIVSEEMTAKQAEHADYTWYIDPLDGTKNFSTKVPLWGINIALSYQGVVKYAAIYLPVTKELCFAKEDEGAYLNSLRISCSQKETWKGIYGIVPVSYSAKNSAFEKTISELSEKTAWFNSIASPAVSAIWVADGRRDFYISSGKNPWDFAAPYLICKEAGCSVKNYNGDNWQVGDKGFIAANPLLIDGIESTVKKTINEI